MIGTLLSPFLAPAGTPVQTPLLWAVLGWVRREIQTTFFNRRPVLAAPTDVVQIGKVVTGVTVGTSTTATNSPTPWPQRVWREGP